MDIGPPYKRALFEGYLNGSLSAQEESALGEWIGSSDQNYIEFKEYISGEQFFRNPSRETVRAWQRIREKIAFHPKQRPVIKTGLPGWLKVAAIVVVALTAGFFADRIIQPGHHTQVRQNEIIVPKGEKARVILSDGSQVYLNAGSHLTYPAIFSKESRRVNLSGEAFFEVKKDGLSPFVIGTPAFEVKVTGTSFNLQAYQEDQVNELTLHSGTVTITKDGQDFQIKPGQKYVFDRETQHSDMVTADLEKSLLWQKDIIEIDSLNLEEIRKVLERKFNVHIEITDEKLKLIRYTGQFKPYEGLTEILAKIRETSPVKFKYDINETRNEIIIRK